MADDSHPHILPIRLYVTIAVALLVLTGVTVGAAQLDFGAGNLVIALAIAGIKATLVALYFMHLKYDHRIYSVVFLGAIAFLAVFIVFTMFDTMTRGMIEPLKANTISQWAIIYDSEGKPIPMEKRVFQRSSGTVASVGEVVDEVPFEIRHGYGPIKEVIDVGPLDTARALRGKEIFEMKCATCHKLDERYTGPPLRGVTNYRSATFIMNQVLDPAQNVSKHPDMQAMLRTYFTIMTNQNVTPEQARTLVEYLRWETERGKPQTNEDKTK
jgi:cytochrome c oxidase subunit 4